MRLINEDKVKVTCVKCRDNNDINTKLINTTSDPRTTGFEYHHEYNGIGKCNKCGNNLRLDVDVYEYPIGFLNHHEYRESGCDVSGGIIPLIVTDDTPKLGINKPNQLINQLPDNMELEQLIKTSIEMSFINLIHDLGYRDEKPFSDTKEDDLLLGKIIRLARVESDYINKLIKEHNN